MVEVGKGFEDFLLEGGDELMNSEKCPKCADVIYKDFMFQLTREEFLR